jgi:hypothetical protein
LRRAKAIGQRLAVDMDGEKNSVNSVLDAVRQGYYNFSKHKPRLLDIITSPHPGSNVEGR